MGALHTNPSEALNTILPLYPIMRQVAGKPVHIVVIKLWAFYHQLSTDFHKVFNFKIPTRNDWGKENLIEDYDVKIYFNCSKMSCGVR